MNTLNRRPAAATDIEEPLNMGSEYLSARTYLAHARARPPGAVKRPKKAPQHGSNDSDFGFADQTSD